jgi:hypothetical protein
MPLGRCDLGRAPARRHWCTTPHRVQHLPPRYVCRLALPRPGHPKKHPARNSTTEDVPKNKGPVRRSSLAQGDQSIPQQLGYTCHRYYYRMSRPANGRHTASTRFTSSAGSFRHRDLRRATTRRRPSLVNPFPIHARPDNDAARLKNFSVVGK